MGSAPLRQPQYPTAIYFHNSSLLWRNICHFLITRGHHYNTLWARPLAPKAYNDGWLSLELAFISKSSRYVSSYHPIVSYFYNTLLIYDTILHIRVQHEHIVWESDLCPKALFITHEWNQIVLSSVVKLCTLNLSAAETHYVHKLCVLCPDHLTWLPNHSADCSAHYVCQSCYDPYLLYWTLY